MMLDIGLHNHLFMSFIYADNHRRSVRFVLLRRCVTPCNLESLIDFDSLQFSVSRTWKGKRHQGVRAGLECVCIACGTIEVCCSWVETHSYGFFVIEWMTNEERNDQTPREQFRLDWQWFQISPSHSIDRSLVFDNWSTLQHVCWSYIPICRVSSDRIHRTKSETCTHSSKITWPSSDSWFDVERV